MTLSDFILRCYELGFTVTITPEPTRKFGIIKFQFQKRNMEQVLGYAHCFLVEEIEWSQGRLVSSMIPYIFRQLEDLNGR